ncbi:MAG TPA: sensor histidine kinase [Desulfurivibrio alkaliphilus]|uniref:histidine kinase n=1 Tax=Desulfurivibrio alkaliphilus TaxID=427923 RepID=A0A7C2TGF6_9BACT|nr:sensor histidine kinase [Desulfurivibrio alkaliphilus]
MSITEAIMAKFKPEFWATGGGEPGSGRRVLNFRRTWEQAILLMLGVSLVPLLALAHLDFQVTRNHAENEMALRTGRLLNDNMRAVSFFLQERRAALQFVIQTHTLAELADERGLALNLEGLRSSVGGFVDLGLFDGSGRHFRYSGPYSLQDLDYAAESWFQEVVTAGVHISDFYRGFRDDPHLVIALRRDMDDGSFYILRATLSTEWFNAQLAQFKRSGYGEAFLVNRQGIVQTPTMNYGEVLQRVRLPELPSFTEEFRVFPGVDEDGRELIIGYAVIPDAPFILMVIQRKSEVLRSWVQTRLVITAFVAVSIILIILVILGVTTRLVNKLYQADHERIKAMQEAEQVGKLASVGRLAAGVAHEINNPLAIINEKAGLMRDLLVHGNQETRLVRMPVLLDAIREAVERCAVITRRLLGFARHLESRWQEVRIQDVIEEVLAFHGKEAEYRNINLCVDVAPEVPVFVSDRGKLQQIFLNLVSNAFAAIGDGGHIYITGTMKNEAQVLVTVTDDGTGIPAVDLKRIFEPFFSTRTQRGGTGLGLSITYGLVRELGGNIQVESAVGVGTRFFVTLPLNAAKLQDGREENANSVG